MRTSEIHRVTKETDVFVSLDLDGSGRAEIATGVGFYDHMTGERRPVTGVNGTPLPDQRVILAELQLQDPAHGRE